MQIIRIQMEEFDNKPARKIMLVGEGATGKTCMLEVYKSNKFPTEYIPTVVDNFRVSLVINDQKISLAIWDSSGQENYSAVRAITYSETEVVIICYAIDDINSFKFAQTKWYTEVRNYIPEAAIVLVGLKSDLRDTMKNEELVKIEEMQRMEREMNAIFSLECSAIKNENVKEVFNRTGEYLLTRKSVKDDKKSFFSCLFCWR
ncbi:hypothetical protein BDAP_002491 [Binucleata daphniae]